MRTYKPRKYLALSTSVQRKTLTIFFPKKEREITLKAEHIHPAICKAFLKS